MKIVSNNHLEVFDELLKNTEKTLFILVPFIKNEMAEHIARTVQETVEIKLITKIDLDSLANNASDAKSINTLRENFSNISVKVYDNLHAKIYIFDSKQALITSANLTRSAFMKNFEYGVLLDEEDINSVLDDFNNIFNNSDSLDDFLKRDISSHNKKIAMDKTEVINSISSLKNYTYQPLEREKQKINPPKSSFTESTEKDPFDPNKSENWVGELSRFKPSYYHISSSIVQLGDIIKFKNDNRLGLNGKYGVISAKTFSINTDKNRINCLIRRAVFRSFSLGNSIFPDCDQYYKAEGTLMKGDVLNNDYFSSGEWCSQKIYFGKYSDSHKDGSVAAIFKIEGQFKYNPEKEKNPPGFIFFEISKGHLPKKQFKIINLDNQNETHVLNHKQIIEEYLDIIKFKSN